MNSFTLTDSSPCLSLCKINAQISKPVSLIDIATRSLEDVKVVKVERFASESRSFSGMHVPKFPHG